MNRTIMKAGAAAAIVAGLMGGAAVVPAAYAEPVVESRLTEVEVSEASKKLAPEVKAMIDKCVAARPSVSYDSWLASKLDGVILVAYEDWQLITENAGYFGDNVSQEIVEQKIKLADKRFAGDLKNLQAQYATLQPGLNLMTFIDPYTGTNGISPIINPLGTNDRMSARLVADPAGREPVKSGKPFYYCVDGNAKTSTIIGRDKGGAVYAQFDLKDKNGGRDQYTLNSFKLNREAGKTYSHTALVVSADKDFAPENSKVVYYSSDAKRDDVFNLGVEPTDDYYVENGEHELFAEGETATGRYVRLYLNGTTDNVGGENVLTEIVMRATETPNKDDVTVLYDTTQLKAAIADAEAVLNGHAAEYTEESVKKLSDAVEAGKNLLASIEAGTATEPLSAPATHAGLINDAKAALVKLFHVTFNDKLADTKDAVVAVADGAVVQLPADPTRPEGYKFAGWFLDESGTKPFDASAPITADLTVYAKWTAPAAELEQPQKMPAMTLSPAKKNDPGNSGALPQTGDVSMLVAGSAAIASAAAFAASRRRK